MQGTITCILNKEVLFLKIKFLIPVFTKSMSHKEVDFVSYIDSKFTDLKLNFMKELKEDLLSNITSLINEQNRQIENLNDKLTKQNSTISVLQDNVKVLNEQCSKLRKDINTKCDELEQYSRRQCLRIEGIVKPRKEKVEDVINLSTKMNHIRTFKELLLNLITSDIDQCSTKIGRN